MRFFLLFIFLVCGSSVYATEFIWTNTQNDNQWDEPLNWIPIGLPGPQDSVTTFYADVIFIPSGFTANIKHIRILGELTIEFGAELNVDGGFMYVVGDVTNRGKISVTNSPDWGIFLSKQLEVNNTFTNQGDIIINSTVKGGLFVRHDQTFQNTGGGLLKIENTDQESIDLQGSLINSGWVNTINPGNDISILMDHEGSSLTNPVCGRLTFGEQIFFEEGDFVNYGFLETNYDGDHYVNPRVLYPINIVNHNFIEDVNGAFAAGDISNMGLWFENYDDVQVGTGQPVHLFSGTLPALTTLSNVYKDRMLTNTAGSFDETTLTFIPNEIANGLASFFIEVYDLEAECRDTVKFTLSEPVLGTNYWLGGSGSWDNANKWSSGVPTATDVVGIFGASDEVDILKDINATAYKILLNGTLKVFEDGSLILSGEGEGSGIAVTDGVLINDGNLLVNEYAVGINLRQSNLANSNELQVLSSDFGINVQGNSTMESTFTNSGSYISDTSTAILVSSGDVTNEVGGTLAFEADGDHTVISGDTIVNSGTITISGLGKNSGTGIASVLSNEATGVVTLTDLEVGLDGGGINFGHIESFRCGIGFKVDNDFTNKTGAKIEASRCDLVMDNAIKTFINEAGAELEFISNGEAIDIQLSTGMFLNDGLISIDTTTSDAISIRGTLQNRGSGIINIANSQASGMFFEKEGAMQLKDEASVRIVKCQEYGIKMQNGSWVSDPMTVTNVDSIVLTGVYLDPSFISAGSTFTNTGNLTVGPTIQGSAIVNRGVFTNTGGISLESSMAAYHGLENSVMVNQGQMIFPEE